jgi:hypothetical protein
MDQATAIRRAAEQDAATILQQATHQAAAIRRAAEQEAAELRAHLLAMLGELSRVSAYVSENLESPGGLATMPAPAIAPAATLAMAPPRPRATPDAPAIAPPRPRTRPDAPAIAPPSPRATSAKKPQGRPRQYRAMRVAAYATAALFLFAVGTGAMEAGLHGFRFFVFRPGGTGETAGSETDQQFLAQQAAARQAAAHHVAAPKGRHVIKSHNT